MKKRTSPKKCLSRQEKFGDSPFLGSLFSLFFLCTLYIYKHVGLLLVMDQFAGTTHLECGVYCRKKMSLK